MLVIPDGYHLLYLQLLLCVCCVFDFVAYIDTVHLFYPVKAAE